jgi:hypothetical protein
MSEENTAIPTLVPPPEMYLGDAVYLTGDGFHIILSAGSHRPSEWDQVVYLDSAVQKNLYRYLHSIYGDDVNGP